MASPTPEPEAAPPGVVATPQGAVPYITYPFTQDYPRLVFGYPRFEPIAIADIINPSVMEACQAILPSLVPPYVTQAANDAVNNLAVRRVGDTMTGALNISPVIPTANAMAASKQYVDTMVATSVPEVPPVPAGQSWMRQTGTWTPATGGGTVTNIATGAGLSGGPITGSGTIAMANMAANSLKGNNTGAVASPVDLNVGQVMNMLGAAPLNSPVFTGSPVLPTGTTGITQPPTTSNTTLATTAFVAGGFVPTPGGTMTGQLVINQAAGTPLVSAPTGIPLWIRGDAGSEAQYYADAYGSGVTPGIVTRFARGTAAAPTAVQLNDALTVYGVVGRGATGYGNANTLLLANASENWTDTAQGSKWSFNTTAIGQTAGAPRMTIMTGVTITSAGATPDPGPGALTLNANTVAPPAGLSGNLDIVGADTTNTAVGLDCFGAATAAPIIVGRHSRGTAAAPTALQAGDHLLMLTGGGATGAGTYNAAVRCAIQLDTSEIWTAANQGSQISFFTTVTGGTTYVNSLNLSGNSATFGGQVNAVIFQCSSVMSIPSGGSLYLNGTLNGNPGRIFCDGNNTLFALQTTSGFFGFEQPSGSIIASIDNSGNLIIQGATAQKPGSTSWVNPSAREIKQDIQPYTGNLGDLLDLTPVTYRYSDDSGFDASETHIGLVHDETAHMPEMHRTATIGQGEDAREVDALDCSAITFCLINAVKELSARLTAVEGRA